MDRIEFDRGMVESVYCDFSKLPHLHPNFCIWKRMFWNIFWAIFHYKSLKERWVSSTDDEISDRDYQFEIFPLQSTLNLEAKDQVWLEITTMPSGVYLAGYTHFTGWLLEEDIYKNAEY
jgi:hypothetical protein